MSDKVNVKTNTVKKLAIIGASYLQVPVISRAKEMGIETHVFSWGHNEEGEHEAAYFYPISVTEKDDILNKCRDIGIDGVCSIASDLASITVNYVAEELNLIGNGTICSAQTTNKALMRDCLLKHNNPIPKYRVISGRDRLDDNGLIYPLIVKPVDRSGSRGVTKIYSNYELQNAIDRAIDISFNDTAIVEEYISGQEYSVEYISWNGNHFFLTITKKFTTGEPHYIETGHLQPAGLDSEITEQIKSVISNALDSLDVKFGASHSEIKITDSGEIYIIEIGARMGGDLIGSSLVRLSTGIDFVGNVIRVALGEKPILNMEASKYAFVRYIFSQDDIRLLESIKDDNPDIIIADKIFTRNTKSKITDSADRLGYFLLASEKYDDLSPYFPMG